MHDRSQGSAVQWNGLLPRETIRVNATVLDQSNETEAAILCD
jgi:hypothetical protein